LTLMLKISTYEFFMTSDGQQKLSQITNCCIDMKKYFSFKP
jgi:hypothetical protein